MSDTPLDYSFHTITVSAGMKELHKLLKSEHYLMAMDLIDGLIVELRMAKAAVRDLEERRR
jgi:hypothetical protein